MNRDGTTNHKKWVKSFKSFQILVPGSISNLGCGFDTLGLAVSLYFKTSIHSAPHFSFTASSRGKIITLEDKDNLFLKVLRQCYPVSPDDWHFQVQIETEVPPKRGLGSSACAAVSAVFTAAKLQNLRHDPSQVLHTVLPWEHHPDNLCASVFGGFTVAMLDDSGSLHHQKLVFPPALKVLLLIPEYEISTEEARRLLPQHYPLEAVVANLQRLAFFMACLQDGNFRGLRDSVRDQIHQPYRAPLMPFARDLLDPLHFPSDAAVVISGSGPSFAIFYRGQEKAVRSAVQEIMARHEVAYDLVNVEPDYEGARIESLED